MHNFPKKLLRRINMRKFIPVLVCLVFILVLVPIRATSQDTKSKYDILLQDLIERVKT